jgi:GT2 family glycosyltransferase
MTNNQNIRLLDIQAISDFSHSSPDGIVVIMPCIDSKTGIKTAEILYQRAGMPCTILVVLDTLRQGFIKTLNQTAVRVTAKYIVYLAQDAWPGRGWLKCAYESLERSGKGLLAFNDGKWQGKIASFGMVRLSWVKTIYNGNVFFPGYRLHGADNELTEIARFQGVYQYNPECTLMEYDPDKDSGGSNPKDKALFEARLQQDFDGMTSMKRINESAEQNITSISPSKKAHYTLQKGVSIIIPTLNGARHLDKLLSSFFRINTFSPLELIIVDHGSTDNTFDILKKYMTKGFVRLIKRDQNYSFSDSCNLGAQKARYPYLLFLNNDIIYSSDVLPKALHKLDLDQGIGAVGLRLDDDPDSLVPGEEQKIQHLGIEFKWNERRGYYQPEQIRHPSLKEFLSSLATDHRPMTSGYAITAAVMLVRKLDFEKLNGFSTEYTYGLEDIDFCLRLRRDLQKKCFCITDMGLQHMEGATRKHWYNTERSKIIENNHRIFKQKWDEYIREKFIHRQQTKDPKAKKQSSPAVHSEALPEEPEIHRPQSRNNNALNILFILPQDLDCNNGYQVKLLARMFQAQGANCTIAVPELSDEQRAMSKEPSSSFNLTSDLCLPSETNPKDFPKGFKRGPLTSVVSYSSLLTDHASRLTSYDAIHAWTPREIVRKFTEKILAKQSCPLIIHLETTRST